MNVTEIEDIHMENTAIIGVDLAKRTFQLHGARGDGSLAFRKKLSREGFLPFLAERPACLVAMEACATAHGWGREIVKLGHEVRLIPTQYVKPYVKRQKNDMADAEAIAEAASRPTMRFVAVKSEESQARAMLFRTRQMFVRQRTQTINALRGHKARLRMTWFAALRSGGGRRCGARTRAAAAFSAMWTWRRVCLGVTLCGRSAI